MKYVSKNILKTATSSRWCIEKTDYDSYIDVNKKRALSIVILALGCHISKCVIGDNDDLDYERPR